MHFEVLDSDTRRLIGSVLMDLAGVSSPQPSRHQSETHSAMKRVVEDLLEKHQLLYKDMINLVHGVRRADDMSFVGEVARGTFSNGITNWGRVASLVAFRVVVCRDLKNGDRKCSVV